MATKTWYLYDQTRRVLWGTFGTVGAAKIEAKTHSGRSHGWTLEIHGDEHGVETGRYLHGGPGNAFTISNVKPSWLRANGTCCTDVDAPTRAAALTRDNPTPGTVVAKSSEIWLLLSSKPPEVLGSYPDPGEAKKAAMDIPGEWKPFRRIPNVPDAFRGGPDGDYVIAKVRGLDAARENPTTRWELTPTQAAVLDEPRGNPRKNPKARKNDAVKPAAVAAGEVAPASGRTPVVMQHMALQVFRGLRKKEPDPTKRRSRAFAITVAALQDAGVFSQGSRKLTRYGRRIERDHIREDPEVLTRKLRAYERMLRAGDFDKAVAEARQNPQGVKALVGRSNVPRSPDRRAYQFYVVLTDACNGETQIESGWEFREDALDRLKALKEEIQGGIWRCEHGQAATARVAARRTLASKGPDPRVKGSWLTGWPSSFPAQLAKPRGNGASALQIAEWDARHTMKALLKKIYQTASKQAQFSPGDPGFKHLEIELSTLRVKAKKLLIPVQYIEQAEEEGWFAAHQRRVTGR